ncbi:MAG: F0F1 ATP synthase subunit epsilon [Chloroflexota bacterium]
MATIRLEVVTPERMVLEDDADIVVARGAEGDLGILHGHEPLITPLEIGELMYRKGSEEKILAVLGGFLEVRPDKVVVLADGAEAADDIDRQQADQERRDAEARLSSAQDDAERGEAQRTLERAQVRLRIAERGGR